MSIVAFGVAGGAAALTVRDGGAAPDELWPYLLAGLLAPGASQIFFTAAVAAAGPSRVSVVVGTAPLFAVAIALVFLDEPLEAGLVAGALLIVAGGFALISERVRPADFRAIGALFALAATVLFATRDNVVRWLTGESGAAPLAAAAASLLGGVLLDRRVPARHRGRAARRAARAARSCVFAPAGVLAGAVVRLPVRGVRPRPRQRREPARGDRVAVGRRALGARLRPEGARRAEACRRRGLVVPGGVV